MCVCVSVCMCERDTSIMHGHVDASFYLYLFMQNTVCVLYTFDTVHSDCIGSFSA